MLVRPDGCCYYADNSNGSGEYMIYSRRLALGYASALALTGSITDSSFAATARRAGAMLGADRYPVKSDPQTVQRLQHLLVHRDEAGGTPHFATLAIRSHDTAWKAIGALDESALQQAVVKFGIRGYRLRRVNAFQTGRGLRYSTIWQLAAGPEWKTRHGMTLTQFEEASGQFAARGFRLAHLDGCATKSGARYSAIWEYGGGPALETFAALTSSAYTQKLKVLTVQGFRPRVISGYAPHGEVLFAAVFEAGSGTGWEAHHELTKPAFEEKSKTMTARGYLLADASGYVLGGRPMFTGVWENA